MISREAPSRFSRSWNKKELQYSWNTRMILMTTDSCSGLAPTASEFSNHACWHSLFLLQYIQSSLVICFWSESELFSCYGWLASSYGYTCTCFKFVRLTSIKTGRFWLSISGNSGPTTIILWQCLWHNLSDHIHIVSCFRTRPTSEWVNPARHGVVVVSSSDGRQLPYGKLEDILSRESCPLNCHTNDEK